MFVAWTDMFLAVSVAASRDVGVLLLLSLLSL